MRATTVLIALVATFAFVHGRHTVTHLVYESPSASATSPVGPPSVKMIYDDEDERIFPNDDDSDELDYDDECEDVPGETYCPAPARLGVTTVAKVATEYGDNVFGKAVNDFGEALKSGYTGAGDFHGPAVSGGVSIPTLDNAKGQFLYGIVAVDGKADKVSSLYRVDYDLSFNKSQDIAMNTEYIMAPGVHGVLSPSAPRITPWCTAMLAEQIALDAFALRGQTDLFAAEFPAKAALIDINHPRPDGNSLTDLTVWMNGWAVEARIDDIDGEVAVLKRYAFGRGNWKGVLCLPDGHTCLFWGDSMLFAFVAENKMGMDYGRLYYATKITDSDGKGKVSWMEFGREASEDPYEMKGGDDEDEAEDPVSIPAGQGDSLLHEDEIKEGLSTWTFEDVFEIGTAATATTCATGFRMVDGTCLKLKAAAKIAARLETVRFAKYLGASAMFAGLEDVAYSREYKIEADGDRAALFMAFSSISAAQAAVLPVDASPNGAVFVASLTSWKNVEDDDDELVTEKTGTWFPKYLTVIAKDNGIVKPSSVAWAHFHNMLLVGTHGAAGVESAIIAVETDDEWLKTSGTPKYQTVYRGKANSVVKGLTWNQNLIGNGDTYLTFGVAHQAGDAEGEFDMVGPMRMRGYMGGTTDQLQNLGCPRFGTSHYLYKEWVSQEWPLPEEDE